MLHHIVLIGSLLNVVAWLLREEYILAASWACIAVYAAGNIPTKETTRG